MRGHEQSGDVADRLEFASGDFFAAVTEGADAYIMKHIIHDWDDERAQTILKNIRRAMKPGGRVLLVEMVIAGGNEPYPGKILDIEMLVSPGGKERTESEYRQLFERAGERHRQSQHAQHVFHKNRVTHKLTPHWLDASAGSVKDTCTTSDDLSAEIKLLDWMSVAPLRLVRLNHDTRCRSKFPTSEKE